MTSGSVLADIRKTLRGIAPRHLLENWPPLPKRRAVVSAGEAVSLFHVVRSLPDCGALQDQAAIEASSRLVSSLGLPSHHDRQKDWDCLKVLYYILTEHGTETPVLDAGSGARSVVLNWLSLLGYRRLFACDRVFSGDAFYRRRGISFSVQEMSRTTFQDGSFGAISSVSVIEHGVHLPSFFREMHRLLRPGGHLLVSTDYWPEAVNTSGIFPYGQEYGEMKVFTRREAEEFCELASSIGLRPCGPCSFGARERAVRWPRVDREYTFLFVAFRKE